jgi:hypothetical protein
MTYARNHCQNIKTLLKIAAFDHNPCCLLTNRITSRETDIKRHGTCSDRADAQAGLDLCLSQTHYVGFVMAWFK